MNDEQMAELVDAMMVPVMEAMVKKFLDEFQLQLDCEITMRQVAGIFGGPPAPN